jgi:hypothetical protein
MMAPLYNNALNSCKSKVGHKISFLWFSFTEMIGRLKISCRAQNIAVIAAHSVCILESPSVQARRVRV